MISTVPSLHTRRLLLRPVETADQPMIFRGLSHPDVIRYYGVSYQSLEATGAQMDFYRELVEQGTGAWWVLCDKETGLFYGAAGFNHYQAAHQKAELGYWLLPEHQRKGMAREAVSFLCDWALTHCALHRIEAQVETGNTSSAQLLLATGFLYEGTLVDCEIKNGQFISLEMYARLASNDLHPERVPA